MDEHFPTIRLEVAGMRHTVIQALNEHLRISQADVTKAVELACNNFNFNAYLQQVMQEAMHRELKSICDVAVQSALLEKRSRLLQLVSKAVEKLVLEDVEEHLAPRQGRRK